MTQNRLQMNVEALTALSRCRSLPEFLAAHTALVRGNVDLTLENSQRLADLSMRHQGGDRERCWPGEYACPSQASSVSHLKANAPFVPGRLHIGRIHISASQ